jgi:hypothetical protein
VRGVTLAEATAASFLPVPLALFAVLWYSGDHIRR